jgi:hypothetical protein
MDRYHIALFVHVFSLIVAAGATAIVKLSLSRRGRAKTVGEMLDWHMVLTKAAILFPICLAGFVLTGGYMLSISHLPWSTGFIVGGLTGVALLLLSGIFLGAKGKALKQLLDSMSPDHPAPKLSGPRFIGMLPFINTGLVLGVVFDMVTKPLAISQALIIVGGGIVLGAVYGMRMVGSVPVPAPEA